MDAARPLDPDVPPLQTLAQYLPGVGPYRGSLLMKLGLKTVEDVLLNVPRDVLDLTNVTEVKSLQAGQTQTVRGAVVDRDARLTKAGKTMTAVLLDCGDGYVRGLWFNQPWMIKKFVEQQVVLFSGKPKWSGGRFEFNSPHVQFLDTDDRTEAIGDVLPRYNLTDGLLMPEMRRITRTAVEQFGHFIVEHLPDNILQQHKLVRRSDAVRQLHLPKTLDEFQAATRRLIFEDLLEFQVGLALRRRMWKRGPAAPQLPERLVDNERYLVRRHRAGVPLRHMAQHP